MDVQDRTSTARDSALADMSGPGQVNPNGPGRNAAADALDRPGVPDGLFRILLVVAGAAAGNSILELIAALSKDPTMDVQLVANREGLRHVSQADVDARLAECPSSGPRGVKRIRTDNDDDSEETPLPSRLVQWADMLLLAPCSASLLASLSVGACDTLPLRLLRSIAPNKPVLIYPSMPADMFSNAWTRRHLEAAKQAGYVVVGPQCRDDNRGRMTDWQDIVISVQDMATFFNMRQQQAHLAKLAEQEQAESTMEGTETGSGPSSTQATRESSPGGTRKRSREGPTMPTVFQTFAPLWHESSPEHLDRGFVPGQMHWQGLPPIATGRTTGLGRSEIDLTMPSWETAKRDAEKERQSDASTPSLYPIIPIKDKWWV
ncbi:protein phosphatase inhibitor [Trichosporon asahii var. asahii CBS 2479]|uniref:Protein phosphatase inhibitor n=1 Tax=Trichosporon asahii var. asahii (strain ATCC 90039 / CBS 2479 / JCM 2466 / KCTC 7840 / NBRC 103889/ NCYC 2677 / UAMH 7654) TaxID=1186058 RepID=J4UBE8_TRIAS|nr:protein phosphatase inhibitor [Trichosporon asahii var. asahii CBS 2479]EJT48175.1 protein phosphatase inhibitor [Trichosporon asahii var. asahii CBS 2479]